jgi:LysR family transcriptional regulator, cyn operon transcriptional activator
MGALMKQPASIKLRQLQYFLKVAELSHFTRAASELSVTQPTLSHQIAQLENDLGTQLLNRVGKATRLTEAGAVFSKYVKTAFSQLEAGRVAVAELEGLSRGTLRIGVIQSFSRSFLPEILGEFMRSYPAVRCVVNELTATAIEFGLQHNNLDLGIAFAPSAVEDIEVEPFLNEQFKLAVSKDHKFSKRSSINISELNNERLALLDSSFSTRNLIDNYMRKAHAIPDIVFEANSWDVILGVAMFSRGAAVVPEQAITKFFRSKLCVVSLKNPVPVRSSALLWPRGIYRTIAAKTLAQMVRKRFGKNAVV